ncbi:uncharacterized protein LOC128552082 [Mercenaria mercenaria]|uniref:uncharacterized protein LOC128552082 n=1 Tax=Mercenaria mercenaria TaxID=6596 RepID=UPI00234E89FC|nr:uncharacterized protein LOC128552082 [Mercenaria mercenaria]
MANASVFRRYEITRQLLPKPCFEISLAKFVGSKDEDIYLQSTSEWYTLTNDYNTIFTLGIAYVTSNNTTIPLSVSGIELVIHNNTFELNYDAQYQHTQGSVLYNSVISSDCQSITFVESDISEFISAGSFIKTMFESLSLLFPDWLHFTHSYDMLLSTQNSKGDILFGQDINDTWCEGAPFVENHLYAVYRFDSGFKIDIFGSKVAIHSPIDSEMICLLVDIYQTGGVTTFVLLPDESARSLQNVTILQTLKQKHNIYIDPKGIGISTVKGIDLPSPDERPDLWNGDRIIRFSELHVSDVWIHGNIQIHSNFFTIDAVADFYIEVPNVQKMLSSLYLDKWNGFYRILLSEEPLLRIKLLGSYYTVPLKGFRTLDVATYSSEAGEHTLCGNTHTPLVYMSTMIEECPLKGLPIFEDWLMPHTNILHGFIVTKKQGTYSINMTGDVMQISKVLDNFDKLLFDGILLFNFDQITTTYLGKINTSVGIIRDVIRNNVFEGPGFNITELENIWQITEELNDYKDKMVDETEFSYNATIQTFTQLLANDVVKIQESIYGLFDRITENIFDGDGNYAGFGLKFNADIKVFQLLLHDIDVEIIYDGEKTLKCEKFEKLDHLLNGASALRFTGSISKEYRYGYFFKLEKGTIARGSISIDSSIVFVQLHMFINMLGIDSESDILLSYNGMHFYLEGTIWGLYLARINATADVGKAWNQLTLHLDGKFSTKDREKRNVQVLNESFTDNFLNVLRPAVFSILENSEKRQTLAEAGLVKASTSLIKAQIRRNDRLESVKNATAIYENDLLLLEKTTLGLEEANATLHEAFRKLAEAQVNIDDLCSIHMCSQICIPGISCKICNLNIRGDRIPYPCCTPLECVTSIPDYECVIENIACRTAREKAYIILERENISVREEMLKYDAVHSAFAFAQFNVNKSRSLLNNEKDNLNLSEKGFEFAKDTFIEANATVDSVKSLIGSAILAHDFVINYGNQDVFNVSDCAFNLTLTTKDLEVFDVFCKINAFRMGWTKIRIRINFKNILQSLWQASWATSITFIDRLGVKDRTRRNVRDTRQSDATEPLSNDTVDIVGNILGFNSTVSSNTDNRILIFKEKCRAILVVQDFIQNSFESLQEILNTKHYVQIPKNLTHALHMYNVTNNFAENKTVESLGISKLYAITAFNMTTDELEEILEETRSSVLNDLLLTDIISFTSDLKDQADTVINAVEAIDFVSYWHTSMKNRTKNVFKAGECDDFKDCVMFSISTLYNLYEAEFIPNKTDLVESISKLESIIAAYFQNESMSLDDAAEMVEDALVLIRYIIKINPFCAEPPRFLTQLFNQTVLNGTSVLLHCYAYAFPEPRYWWLKNGEILDGQYTNKLYIPSVYMEDATVKYNCIAGNIVANVTSKDAYLVVISEDTDECEVANGGCQHICHNTVGSYECSCNTGYILSDNGGTCSDVNECAIQNGGCDHRCTNRQGTFRCVCNIGYELQKDNTTCVDINECKENNGGCRHLCSNGYGSFTCSCNLGYELSHDNASCIDVNECDINNGGCAHLCTNKEGSFSCSCKYGYELQNDSISCIDVNECDTLNGGCEQLCTNQEGSFSCSCYSGFELQNDSISCIDVNECDTLNGGCEQLCTNQEGSFSCSCYSGFELQNDSISCADEDECEILNGGCEQLCTYQEGSFSCSCYSGFELQNDNISCADVNECDTLNGGCEQLCINQEGSFSCSCYSGFELQNDSISCIDVNECDTLNGGCEQLCTNQEGSFSCSCYSGFELQNDRISCIDVNECDTLNGGCEQLCTNQEGSFSCSCYSGFELQNDSISCIDVNECDTLNGGCEQLCTNQEGSFSCSCYSGFELQNDSISCADEDECEILNGGCEQLCTNQEGSFSCSCYSGFELQNDNISCADVNECDTLNGGCEQLCINQEGSFSCSCYSGFELQNDNISCADVNECEILNGGCEQLCTNQEGSFSCSCYSGFELQNDSISCIDVNECDTLNGGCEQLCTNQEGSFSCSCYSGFELQNDSISCIDVNECDTLNGGCEQLCINQEGSFSCSCYSGFELQNDNISCADEDECEILNGGCEQQCTNQNGPFSCSCYSGFELQNDSISCSDVDECGTLNGGCEQQCTNHEGFFSCSCYSGFQLQIDSISCADEDECGRLNGGCEQQCTNQNGSFSCSCDSGYELQNDSISCSDVDECDTLNGGCLQLCINQEGSFSCSCDSGFELQKDSISCNDVNECEILNGGCEHLCTNGNGSFFCSCNSGFELHNNKTTCIDVNECNINNGGCEQQCTNQNGSFFCSCNPGYQLQNDNISCIDVNNCDEVSVNCDRQCVNVKVSFTCRCNETFTRNDIYCYYVDKCEPLNVTCHQRCLILNGSLLCSCDRGYILSEDGFTCIDVRNSSIVSTVKYEVDSGQSNLQNISSHIQISENVKESLLLYFRNYTLSNVSISISGIRTGSIIADFTLVYGVAVHSIDRLVLAIVQLYRGVGIRYGGTLVKAKAEFPENVSTPCDIRYFLIGECKDGLRCQIISNKPVCKNVSQTSEGFSSYSFSSIQVIITVIAGLFLMLLTVTIPVLVVRYRRKHVDQRYEYFSLYYFA